jgi:hypothetical protein
LVVCYLWIDGECIVHRVLEKDRPDFKIEVLEYDKARGNRRPITSTTPIPGIMSRASQFREVSWFAALVMDAFDLSEYQRFERIGAKLAAAFGIFLKSQYPEAGIGGIGNGPQDPPDYIEPGRIQKLPTGAEIQFASHKGPAGLPEREAERPGLGVVPGRPLLGQRPAGA